MVDPDFTSGLFDSGVHVCNYSCPNGDFCCCSFVGLLKQNCFFLNAEVEICWGNSTRVFLEEKRNYFLISSFVNPVTSLRLVLAAPSSSHTNTKFFRNFWSCLEGQKPSPPPRFSLLSIWPLKPVDSTIPTIEYGQAAKVPRLVPAVTIDILFLIPICFY